MLRKMGHLVQGIGLSRFLQWRVNTMLMRWLPFMASRMYLRLVGRLYYVFAQDEKEQIRENLLAVLRWRCNKESSRWIIGRTFQGIFAHYHEKLFTAYGGVPRVCGLLSTVVQFHNRQLLDDALALGRGVILVTGHFGGVEFLPSILALNGYPVTMVARFKTERLKRTLNLHAQRVGITLLDAGKGEGVIFGALHALRANRILITECDEFRAWRPYRKQSASFLGYAAPVDRTLDLLHRRYKSPVLMGLVSRERRKRYHLKLQLLDGEQDCPGPTVGPQALRVLERYILEEPDQWYQWKDVRVILGRGIFADPRALAPEKDRPLSVADSAIHAREAQPGQPGGLRESSGESDHRLRRHRLR